MEEKNTKINVNSLLGKYMNQLDRRLREIKDDSSYRSYLIGKMIAFDEVCRLLTDNEYFIRENEYCREEKEIWQKQSITCLD